MISASRRVESLGDAAKERLGFDDQQGILPGSQATGEEDKETAIDAGEARAFDRAREHDELLPQQEVLSDQLGFTAGKVGDGAQRKGGGAGLGLARDHLDNSL